MDYYIQLFFSILIISADALSMVGSFGYVFANSPPGITALTVSLVFFIQSLLDWYVVPIDI